MARACGPVRDESELPALAEMLSWSFGFPAADAEPWLRSAGVENLRVARDEDQPSACLVLIPMGQFFGGRSVPMVGVAGVATAADRRGTGAAAALMRATIEELAGLGTPISVLYPATRSLYRSVGYEPAGVRFEYKVPLSSILVRDRGLEVRPIRDADEAEVLAIYRAQASAHEGTLDRGPYVWNRIRNVRREHVRGFAFGAPGRASGYVYLYEKVPTPGDPRYDLYVTDAVALTPGAASRILSFFADHRSLGANVRWHGGPADPLAQALPEVGYAMTLPLSHWMLRITDAAAALASRGYPHGVQAEVELDVADPLVGRNHGRFVLSVADGAGEVRRGGSGALRIDVRGLAALYTGHASPSTLVSLGLLDGSPGQLARLGVLFGGASPWMRDFF